MIFLGFAVIFIKVYEQCRVLRKGKNGMTDLIDDSKFENVRFTVCGGATIGRSVDGR